MRLHLHRWTQWEVAGHYIDISWGGEIPSTSMIRHCTRCGLYEGRELYGVTVPLSDADGAA